MDDHDVELAEVQRDAVLQRLRIEGSDIVPREAAERVDVVEDRIGVAWAVVAEQEDASWAGHERNSNSVMRGTSGLRW